jgi:hypothetical protein
MPIRGYPQECFFRPREKGTWVSDGAFSRCSQARWQSQANLPMRLTMRIPTFMLGVAAVLFTLTAGASAMPTAGAVSAIRPESSAVVPVRMICDHLRCFDPRSGAYTHSACDRRGCYRTGPVVGYLSDRQLRDFTSQHGYRSFRGDDDDRGRRGRRGRY